MYSKRIGMPAIMTVSLVLATLLFRLAAAIAQGPPLPPPGSYIPIPNFTGTGAGALFRKAINDRFSGSQPVSPQLVAVTFANLPTESDGSLIYCSDCKIAAPCVGGGAGTWAAGVRGAWTCSQGALEAALNANGNKITGLGAGSIAGDSIAFAQTGSQLGAYLTPFLRSGSTTCTANGTSVVCNKPVPTQVGDTLVMCANWYVGSGSLAAMAAGFTQIGTTIQGNSNSLICGSRIADGTEASSFTMSFSMSGPIDATVLDIANGASSGSIDASAGGTSASGTSYAIGAPATTNASDLMLVVTASSACCAPPSLSAPSSAKHANTPGQTQISAFFYPGAAQSATGSLPSSTTASFIQIGVLPLSELSSNLALKGQSNDTTALFGTGAFRYAAVTNPMTGFSINGCANPVAYGADPTGVMDSSTAFDAAYLAACNSSSDVCIPAGTYDFIAPWLAKCPAGIFTNPSIFGAGRRSTFLKNTIAGH